jgi:hypothetical protein
MIYSLFSRSHRYRNPCGAGAQFSPIGAGRRPPGYLYDLTRFAGIALKVDRFHYRWEASRIARFPRNKCLPNCKRRTRPCRKLE